jgi:hypothetical protein
MQIWISAGILDIRRHLGSDKKHKVDSNTRMILTKIKRFKMSKYQGVEVYGNQS